MNTTSLQSRVSVRPEIDAEVEALGLRPTAAGAFRALCNAGCKPDTLAGIIQRWALEKPVVSLPKGRTIHLRPRDDWGAALGGLRQRDLLRLREQLKTQANKLARLAAKVRELQATRVFKYMYGDGEFRPDAHLLDLATRMKGYAEALIPKVIKACANIGPKRQPDRNQSLLRLGRYIKACTGRPHHQEISDVLSHFEPMRIGTLKKILSRQGFTRRK
jgi:hypothetical protein